MKHDARHVKLRQVADLVLLVHHGVGGTYSNLPSGVAGPCTTVAGALLPCLFRKLRISVFHPWRVPGNVSIPIVAVFPFQFPSLNR